MKNRTIYLFFICLFVISMSLDAGEKKDCSAKSSFIDSEQEVFGFSMDYLLFRSINENLAFANRVIIEETPGAIFNRVLSGNMLRPKRTFRPGFRIAAVGKLPYGTWQIQSDWTYYYNKSVLNNHVDGMSYVVPNNDLRGSGIVAYWSQPYVKNSTIGSGTTKKYTSLHGVWQLNYNSLDLYAYPEISVIDFLTIVPRFGLENSWIHQKMATTYTRSLTGITDTIVTGRNNFWGIGPSFGVNFLFDMGLGFSVVADTVASLLIGRTTVRMIENSSPTDGNDFVRTINSTNRVNEVLPKLGFKLGLDWSTLFDSYYSMSIGAFWESMYYWGQFRYLLPISAAANHRYFISDGTNYPFANSGLQIEGISVKASFGF